MGNELVTLSGALGALVTRTADDSEFKQYKRSAFLPRIQFYSKGNAYGESPEDQIAMGHYGVPLASGKIQDLGSSIDVLPVAMRMKGMDLNDLQHVVVTCDTASEEYQRIRAAKLAKKKNYLCGPSFLVIERNTSALYELFCGSNTLEEPANFLQDYCPLSPADCAGSGRPASDAHDPLTATLASTKRESLKYNSFWFVSTVNKCRLPITNLPDFGVLVAEIEKFLAPVKGVETVSAADAPERAR